MSLAEIKNLLQESAETREADILTQCAELCFYTLETLPVIANKYYGNNFRSSCRDLISMSNLLTKHQAQNPNALGLAIATFNTIVSLLDLKSDVGTIKEISEQVRCLRSYLGTAYKQFLADADSSRKFKELRALASAI